MATSKLLSHSYVLVTEKINEQTNGANGLGKDKEEGLNNILSLSVYLKADTIWPNYPSVSGFLHKFCQVYGVLYQLFNVYSSQTDHRHDFFIQKN